MSIIVTGGSGRLGRSVVAGLAAEGHDVVSIDRAHPPAADALSADAHAAPRIRTVDHDLTDEAATHELFAALAPQAVVHLAAIAVPFSAPEREILLTNTALTHTVLSAAIAAGADRVLVASSPTVIGYGAPHGWSPQYLPIDEQHPVAPWNAYALSKQVMEETVAMFVRSTGDRVRFGLFRPCFVISPEEWEGAPTQQGHTLVERLADPSLASVSLFNYVDARDAADFVDHWLRRAHDVPNGSTFFVGAADALALDPLSTLLPESLPALGGSAAHLVGTAPAFSSDAAARLLGWRATRSWRTELPAEALTLLLGANAPTNTAPGRTGSQPAAPETSAPSTPITTKAIR